MNQFHMCEREKKREERSRWVKSCVRGRGGGVNCCQIEASLMPCVYTKDKVTASKVSTFSKWMRRVDKRAQTRNIRMFY